MEEIFQKIEDNIFETQEGEEQSKNQKSNDLSDDTTDDSSKFTKLAKKIKTEAKNKKNSNLFLENNENEEEKEDANFDKDEYADYGRIDKTGIHFQIISDHNVSMEIVPDDLLRDDIKDLIIKYKGVFDTTMNLWIIPYINYEKLFNELNKIEGINTKLHKVGAIAKECYEKKTLTTLIYKRKEKEEKIDYLEEDELKRDIETLPIKLKNALYDFQIEGVKFGIEHHCRFLLADEMGVGKTIQAIALSYIYRDSWPVLIVCPGSMKYLWKGEIQTWLGLKNKRINILNASKQKISEEAYFYIISYDLVKNMLKKLRKMTFNFVILDEAHSIKNRESLRAKNILPIAIRAKRLILMTGTPLLAKPLEGYPLLYALRPDLFPYFKKYAYRYCDPQPTPFGISWSGTSNTKELHWILSTLMVRRLKKDVLNNLPPKRRQKVIIDTDPNVISQIKEARTKIKGRTGTLEAYTLTASAKKEGVCQYISDLLETDEKIIIFAYHHEMLDRIEFLMEEKNIDYIRIDGSTKQDKRYEYVTYFQRKTSCQVAILSIIAASTGITLNSAHIVIFAELTWTPSIMIQAEDRAHRIGQKSEFVDIKYLYGQETLDDFILDKLQKKLVIVSTTVDDKKENFGVKADPNLIHPEGLNSKELIRMAKGEINLYDDDSNNSSENEDEDNIEKKILKDLESEFGDLNENEEKNNEKGKIKENKKEKLKSNNNENSKDENEIESFLKNENLDFEILNGIKNEDIFNDNNLEINSNNNNFANLNDNINEIKSPEKKIKYPKSEIKSNSNNMLYLESDKKTNKNNKFIKKEEKNNNLDKIINNNTLKNNESSIKNLEKYKFNGNFNNINENEVNKKEIEYPKEETKKDIDNNNNTFEKDITHKKVTYPKRRKTPITSEGKRKNIYKLSAFKKLQKYWTSNNKAKSTNKNKKKKNSDQKHNKINIVDIDKEINDNNFNDNQKDKDKKPIDQNKYLKNYENELMVNLHKVNMRRNTSQQETKQSQTYNLEDKSKVKFKSEQKNIFFPSNKYIFNENFFYNNNDKVPLK